MKISIFYDHIKSLHIKENIEIPMLAQRLKERGVCGFDLSWSEVGNNPHYIAAKLKEWDFVAASIYAVFNFADGFDQAKIDALIRGAKFLKVKNVMIVPGNIPHGADISLCFENMLEALTYACDIAEHENISICIEDFDNLTSPTVSIAGLSYFFDNEPRLRFNLDTGNFCCAGDDIFKAIKLYGDRITHVHLKDRSLDVQDTAYITHCADGKTYYPAICGSGLMQIGEVIAALKNIGYDGYLALEYFGEPESDKIFKSLDYVKENI